MKPVCPVDYFLVEIDKRFQDVVNTASGVLLYRDTTYHPEQHATITGRIVSVPSRITPELDTKDLIVQGSVGDEVIFSYLVVMDWERHKDRSADHNNEVTIDNKTYWKVHARWILGFMREGKIIPAAGYVYMEEQREVRVDKIAGGLILPEMMQERETKGMSKVVHIGEPRKEKIPLDINEGDTVIYDPRFVQQYEIGGKNWLVLEQEYVIAKKVA